MISHLRRSTVSAHLEKAISTAVDPFSYLALGVLSFPKEKNTGIRIETYKKTASTTNVAVLPTQATGRISTSAKLISEAIVVRTVKNTDQPHSSMVLTADSFLLPVRKKKSLNILM